MTTVKLGLPEMTASQNQKHVTHNEALFLLDQITQLTVLDKDLSTPPGSPASGDAYIVGAAATSDWASHETDVAVYDGTGWIFMTPQQGWKAWVDDENAEYRFEGSAWSTAGSSATPNGASSSIVTVEDYISGMSGATAVSTAVIPARCVLQGVSTYTETAITGATSYDCGPTGGSVSAYGGSLGIAPGSNNIGVIGPTAFYSDTTITLTANGGNFTGGAVRIGIHYLAFTAPSS